MRNQNEALKEYLFNYFQTAGNQKKMYEQIFLIVETVIHTKKEKYKRKGEYKTFLNHHWEEARDKAIDAYFEHIEEAKTNKEKAEKLLKKGVPYFTGIYNFKVIDVYTKLKKQPSFSLNEAIGVFTDEEEAQPILLKQVVNWSVSALPSKQRSCMYLRNYKEMSMRQIAETIDLPTPDSARKNYKAAEDNFRILYTKMEIIQKFFFSQTHTKTLDERIQFSEYKIQRLEKNTSLNLHSWEQKKENMSENELLFILNSSFPTLKDKQMKNVEEWLKNKDNELPETQKTFLKWQDTICFYLEYFYQNKN